MITVLLIILISQCYFGETKFIEATIKDQLQNDALNSHNDTVKLQYKLVSRDKWLAQPPKNELIDLELPSKRVVIAHTGTENCSTQAQCTFRTRFIQTYHMESRSFDDIAYNFLVGGDGAVYEGRGWDKEGAHSKGFNKRTICIAFIGTFIKLIPTEGQLKVTQLLIEEGLRLGKLTKDYRLYGQRQLIPTESPGDALYKIIQTWPHYSTELGDTYQ